MAGMALQATVRGLHERQGPSHPSGAVVWSASGFFVARTMAVCDDTSRYSYLCVCSSRRDLLGRQARPLFMPCSVVKKQAKMRREQGNRINCPGEELVVGSWWRRGAIDSHSNDVLPVTRHRRNAIVQLCNCAPVPERPFLSGYLRCAAVCSGYVVVMQRLCIPDNEQWTPSITSNGSSQRPARLHNACTR